ncbi:MAG: class F sortase [Chloroflexota bacterium]
MALLFLGSAALAIAASGTSSEGVPSGREQAASADQVDSTGTSVETEVPPTSTPEPSTTPTSTNTADPPTPDSADRAREHGTPTEKPGAKTAKPDVEPTPERDPLPRAGQPQLASFAPKQIQIPSLEVDAPVVSVGINEAGAMAAPEDFGHVAWYQHGATPGENGRAVLAGHVDSYTGPAVFYRLKDLQAGDEIFIHSGPGGPAQRFIVRESASYETDLAPVDQIFGDSDRPELILITCSGPFDRNSGRYLERHVVYADLAPQDQAGSAP